MSKKKLITVKLADLKTNLFVREALNEDRVMFLWELHESGVKLDPMTVCLRTMEIIDGRHRKEVYELLSIKEVEVEVITTENDIELISLGYKSNTGGAMPPTQADTEHTIRSLLDRGATKKSIAELLGLPISLARKYINSVESRVKRAKLNQAAHAVAEEGLTVSKAAEQFGVLLEDLKALVSGSKTNRKKSGVEEVRRDLTRRAKSHSAWYGSLLRKLLERLDDGETSPTFVTEIFDHIEQIQIQHIRSVGQWKDRFKAKVNGKGNGESDVSKKQ